MKRFKKKSIIPLARNQLFWRISMLLSPLPSFNSETRHVHSLNLLGLPGFSQTDHRDLSDGAIRGSFGYPKAKEHQIPSLLKIIGNCKEYSCQNGGGVGYEIEKRHSKSTQDTQIQEINLENVAGLKKLIHSCWWFSRCPANLRRHVCASYHISTAFGGKPFGNIFPSMLNEELLLMVVQKSGVHHLVGKQAVKSRDNQSIKCLGGDIWRITNGSPTQVAIPVSRQATFCPLLRLRIKVHIFGCQARYAVIVGSCSKKPDQTTV